MELWLLLGLLVPVLKAGSTALVKHLLDQGVDACAMAWILRAVSVPFIIGVVIVYPPPTLFPPLTFWLVLVASGTLGTVATLFSVRSLSLGDMSLVVPIKSISPALVIGTGFFILGEMPGPYGIGGVILIVLGTYTLNLKPEEGWLEPFKVLYREKWARLILGVVVIYAITPPLEKMAIVVSTPSYWLVWIHFFLIGSLFVETRRQGVSVVKPIKNHWPVYIGIGLLSAGYLLAQTIMLKLALAVYMSAFKRIAILVSVLIGGLWMGEDETIKRLIGSALIVGGILLIGIFA